MGMETQNNRGSATDRSKLIAAVAVVLLGASIGWHLLRNISEQHDLDTITAERVKNRQAQTDLADRTRDLAMAHAKVGALEGEANEQETLRIAAERRATESRQLIHTLEGKLAAANKWRQEAETARAAEMAAQRDLTDMRVRLDASIAENGILLLDNTGLKDELDRLAQNKAFIDASLTEAFRGKKERLTVLARKTRKLQVSMTLPANTAHSAQYILTAPDGEVIRGDQPGMSIISRPSQGQQTADLGGVGSIANTEDVKLVYMPKKKLKPGLYRMEVRTGEGSIGTTFLSLR